MWRPVTLLKHGAFSAVLFLLVFCVWFLGEHSSSDVMAVRQVRRENEGMLVVFRREFGNPELDFRRKARAGPGGRG